MGRDGRSKRCLVRASCGEIGYMLTVYIHVYLFSAIINYSVIVR